MEEALGGSFQLPPACHTDRLVLGIAFTLSGHHARNEQDLCLVCTGRMKQLA